MLTIVVVGLAQGGADQHLGGLDHIPDVVDLLLGLGLILPDIEGLTLGGEGLTRAVEGLSRNAGGPDQGHTGDLVLIEGPGLLTGPIEGALGRVGGALGQEILGLGAMTETSRTILLTRLEIIIIWPTKSPLKLEQAC